MKHKLILITATAALLLGFGSCTHEGSSGNGITVSPEAGTSYKSGDAVTVKAHYPDGTKPDSIVYLVDSARVGGSKDSSAFLLKTGALSLGPRVITARVFQGGKSQEGSTNIVLLAPKAPENYTFKVIKTFPHNTSCYTEGLVYLDGFLYESGGGYLKPPQGQEKADQSSLRKVDLNTGKVIKKTLLDSAVFGEGISIVGNKIIQLTYHEKVLYVYDKDSFARLSTLPNNVGVEGWGMCFDGQKLYMDDSTNRIWFLDKDNYKATGFIDVYDDKGAVGNINELEYIDGKIYANIWQTDTIVVIDPKTGAVLQRIDLTNLYPEGKRAPGADVLNGIAYDAAGKRIFITGKKWPNLYQVEFVKK